MPIIRYFTVREEREIKVSADSPAAAVLIGAEALTRQAAVSTEDGRTTSEIKTTSVEAREDY